jgi:hypothetical protein
MFGSEGYIVAYRKSGKDGGFHVAGRFHMVPVTQGLLLPNMP